MGVCSKCGASSLLVSSVIGYCVNCLRSLEKPVEEPHVESRSRFKLPVDTSRGRYQCSICGRGCRINDSSMGYCGYRRLQNNRLTCSTSNPRAAIGLYYYDPHPTNCVAFPVCPAITGIGYPDYALSPWGEQGYYNIAVFYGGCNMDCLYCQNWEYREMIVNSKPVLSIESLVNAVNKKTSCVCFFGGDPGPFAPHALLAAREMIDKAHRLGLRVFRVCWETNGLWNPRLLEEAVKISLKTGGIVKIDFKAWSPRVYEALCGVDEKHVELIKENIKLVAKYFSERPSPPLLVISTLLVPGYIDEYELDNMTSFIASINPEIPYVFLGFHPDYMLLDLPTTSKKHAEIAVKIARRNGLKRVYVGNTFLLGDAY